jgi:hypothetical protein
MEPMTQVTVECLRCGFVREVEGGACPRCGYVGWAYSYDLTEDERRDLRDHPVEARRVPRPEHRFRRVA